jgi:hypothetical protein
MQTTASRMTSIEQLYDKVGAMKAPVLIHVDGAVEWANRSFLRRFDVNEEAVATVRVKELLWCLGIVEPVAGMISEGALFRHVEMPAANPADSSLYLKQICLATQQDGRKRMMLVLADEFDPACDDDVAMAAL